MSKTALPAWVADYARFLATADAIRAAHRTSTYDHRPTQPSRRLVATQRAHETEEFVRKYAGFKWAVAHVLQPREILELGVGSGISTFAFLDAVPTAQYVGIDNGRKDTQEGYQFLDHVAATAKTLARAVTIRRQDTRTLTVLPRADLLHVDAAHGYADVVADVVLALESRSTWILCDDCRWAEVTAGVFAALRAAGGHRHWAYFEDTWTGNILIHNIDVA